MFHLSISFLIKCKMNFNSYIMNVNLYFFYNFVQIKTDYLDKHVFSAKGWERNKQEPKHHSQGDEFKFKLKKQAPEVKWKNWKVWRKVSNAFNSFVLLSFNFCSPIHPQLCWSFLWSLALKPCFGTLFHQKKYMSKL